MTLHRFEHLGLSSLDETLALLKEKGEKAKVVAGGSELLVHLKHRTLLPEFVIDIKDLDELRGIVSGSGNRTIVGPLTTLDTIATSKEILDRFPILAKAASRVGSVQIRNVGTIGGNICLNTRCWYYNQSAQWRKSIPRCYKVGGDQCLVMKNSDRCNAVFVADTVPALIALDAKVKILKKEGERTVPIEGLFGESGHPPNLLDPDEILAEIQIPETPPNSFSVFYKDAPRQVLDFPLVDVAIRITFKDSLDVCEDARIAVGGVTSHPVRSIRAENVLKGREIRDDLIGEVTELVVKDCAPISPIWVSPNQRRETVRHLVRKGLKEAVDFRQRGESL
ncbi:MAG: xanthine dehydrogenase family protein subunit M [Deltaproteobacteria bacterium]|nr:xanthine dehydrogenase family protein subunit M [Deltaproteobacteria bacterium]